MREQIRTVLHVFPSFAVGGVQMRFAQIANHFGSRYRHRIVAMDGNTQALEHLANSLDVRIVTVENHRRAPLRNARAFRMVLQQVRPDVLVTSNWGSIDWAIANIGRSTPHVHMEDGFGSDEGVHQIRRRIWARKLLLRHSVTVVPSLTLYGIARDLWGLPERRIIHVANGVDCLRFRASPDTELLARLRIAKNVPVIGAVAPLRPEKNLRRLIDAFALLRRDRAAQLVIVGDGPEREKLQLHAAERGVAQEVVFTGFCPAPDRLLGAFSLVALSSDTEQMPLSVLEAMAAGRAVAATDVGDIRQMLAKENHPFLVERSAEQLARAMARLLNDPAAASAIGTANARRAAEAYDQRQMFEAYGHLFG